jgi:hypothetical protein
MAKQKRENETTVTLVGDGFRSIKSTEQYTPDTAPINYQDSEVIQEENDIIPPVSPQESVEKQHYIPEGNIELKPFKPLKEIDVSQSFFANATRVYISGFHPSRGNVILKNRKILDDILNNNGNYHIVVPPPLKQRFLDIIENAGFGILGREVSSFERDRIAAIFKKDNALS